MGKRVAAIGIFPLMLAISPVSLAAAERAQPANALGRALKSSAAESTSPGARPSQKSKACPEYGPGFVRIEGSSTCVRASGSVQVDVSGQR
ncbi:MAG TPA: hypothetical protein VGC86_00385 [Afipia sp.]